MVMVWLVLQHQDLSSIVIKDCAGDTIWEMTNPSFGSVLYSGPQQSACPVIPDVFGCTDPLYQEYNPNV